MNMKLKCLAVIGAAVLAGTSLTAGEAARIDNFRSILEGGSYTIKYDNITPSERVTNRDKVDLFGRAGLSVDKNDYLTNRPKSGIVVNDGNRRYEEVGDGNFNSCRLAVGNENFFFTKYEKDSDEDKNKRKSYEYFGVKKNKVEATTKNFLAEAVGGLSYGDSEMTAMINAMLSVGKEGGYIYVNGGTLNNGQSYEDYQGKSGGRTQIIRYYFEGDTLVKIAAANFYRTEAGVDGHKCIIKVSEFSNIPDVSLLKLPAGVEDITERKGSEGKDDD